MSDNGITERWLASLERRGKRRDIGRMKQGATRLGITLSEYRAHVLAGLNWCSGHGQWCRAEDFGPHSRTADGINTMCREADRARSREYQRRKRAAMKGAAA